MEKYKFVLDDENAVLPKFADNGAGGMDLCSIIDITIPPMGRVLVPTGIKPILDDGHHLLVLSRSGMAAKYGIFVLNAPGLIDSSYTGEIKVILQSLSSVSYEIHVGDKIAQLMGVSSPQMKIEVASPEEIELKKTTRGNSGFGSTGR
jgi:dUTP pyrophosphatase